MVTILELPRQTKPCSQSVRHRNEMFSALVRAKVLASFRIVEAEVVPLLREIGDSLERALGDVRSVGGSQGLPDGTLESIRSLESLVCNIHSLIECYQTILVPESSEGNS